MSYSTLAAWLVMLAPLYHTAVAPSTYSELLGIMWMLRHVLELKSALVLCDFCPMLPRRFSTRAGKWFLWREKVC